jgi:hypothetical protein
MALFVLCAFPLVLLGAFFTGDSKPLRVPAVIFGLGAGITVCSVQALFVFPPVLISSAFLPLFLNTFFSVSLLPALVLGALFFFLFKADSRQKVHAFFFVYTSFYVIMLPYRLLSSVVPTGYFEMHLAALMYVVMAVIVPLLLRLFYTALVNPGLPDAKPFGMPVAAEARLRATLSAFAACMLTAMALPAAAEAARWTGKKTWGLLTVIFFVYASAVVFYMYKTRSPKKDAAELDFSF